MKKEKTKEYREIPCFHFLEDSGSTLNILEKSSYNIIISNTQKLLLKRKHKNKSKSELLFQEASTIQKVKSLNQEYSDLYELDEPLEETELTSNQRFSKLTRIHQLGLFVDEAHHIFGTKLQDDFDPTKISSLRLTINELAFALGEWGAKIVACQNFTGTPYVQIFL